MSASEQLPPEKLEQVKTVFNLYDYKRQGYIPPELVERLCKNLGAYVTTDEVHEFTEFNFQEGSITFEKFLEFFAEHYLKKIDKTALINAFQFLDKGKTGTISAQELKHSLMVIGDKLKEEESDELLQGFVERGVVDYRRLATEFDK